MDRLVLHEDPISANCYKIKLAASLVSVPLELQKYSILKGDTRTPDFLKNVSSYGRIPVLQIGDSTFLPESNAACYYLADTNSSPLIPSDPLLRAEMLRWMFFEQNQHEVNIATLRFWLSYVGEDKLDETQIARMGGMTRAGRAVLDHMDNHLEKSLSGWFVGGDISLADICLYAYTHVAHEGGFELNEWPAVKRWCGKLESVSGYVKM